MLTIVLYGKEDSYFFFNYYSHYTNRKSISHCPFRKIGNMDKGIERAERTKREEGVIQRSDQKLLIFQDWSHCMSSDAHLPPHQG